MATERETRLRLRNDFEYYARHCLTIRTKNGDMLPLVLNAAQQYLHAEIERQRAETGRIRALVLKGRQQGCSTYTEARYFWKTTNGTGLGAYILTHDDTATTNLFNMAKQFYDCCPAAVKPIQGAANAKELFFPILRSGYKVGTAGGKAAGRGQTFQLFHGSEVAYWPFAESHVAGALQAVADLPGTEVILESTSAGRSGLFYKLCEAAMRGEGEYKLVFIPWFWQPEYRKRPPDGFALTADELDYQLAYALDLAQMAWRRSKIIELLGVGNFRREYPATPQEAFSAEAEGALWTRERIDNHRRAEPRSYSRIVVAIDPSGGSGERNDEVGIVAAGLADDGTADILGDWSGKYSPAEWGRKAVQVYHELEADRIVGEANFGGDMVEAVIRTADPNVSYKAVIASRGKRLRAEPVAALYEQGRISHVGTHIGLEDEMVTWDPVNSKKSPNRIDAAVWAITELMLEETTTGLIDYYRQQSEEMNAQRAQGRTADGA